MDLEPHDYRIYYVNIDLRHQYGISVGESQTFLRAKRPQRRRAGRNGCFRGLPTKDLVTVFDAILTGRQTRKKLQCLYEKLMSNNFHRTAVLKKNRNCKLKLHLAVLRFCCYHLEVYREFLNLIIHDCQFFERLQNL